MQITFSGTTDNQNFDILTNQTTEYKVLDRDQKLIAKTDQKVVIKDETIIFNSGASTSDHPQVIAENRGSEVTFDSCNIQTGVAYKLTKQIRGNINLINSRMLIKPKGDRVNTLRISKIEGLALKVDRKTPREQMFLDTNPGAIIQGLPGKPNIFEGLWCIEVSKGVKIKDTSFKNTGPNILNWSAGNISVRGLTLYDGTPKENSVDCDAWINANNSILFYSCKLRLNHVNGGDSGKASRFICINEKYTQNNLKMKYTMKEEIPSGSASYFNQSVSGDHVTSESLFRTGFLTLEDGKLKKDGQVIPYIDLLTEVTTNVRLNQATGMNDPSTIALPNTHKVNWSRTFRHPSIKTYTDEIVDQTEDIGASLGTPTVDAEVKLTVDEEYRPIENSSEINFAPNTPFDFSSLQVYVNGVMTVQDIYNKWKEFLYKDDGFEYPEDLITAKNGVLTIKGDITFRHNVPAPLQPDHLNQVIATQTITIGSGAVVSVPYADTNTVGSIEVIGVKGCKVRIKKVRDKSVILETAIQNKSNAIITLTPTMLAEPVYITKVSSEDLTLAGTNALTLVKGVNDPVQLYSGEQVQITNIDDLKKIKTNLKQINGGIKKSQMLIPYTEDLQD